MAEPNKDPIKIAEKAQEQPIKILLVDDEEDARVTLAELLEMNEFKVTATQNGTEALRILQDQPFDLVISDLFMPGVDGIALTKAIHEKGINIPVIVMTGFASIETAVESMKAGATDYINKPFNLDHIKIIIDRTLEKRRLQQLAKEREYFENLSNLDALTELNNYRYFHHVLQLEIDRQKRYRRPLSLMMIDIDDFKICNDTFGHVVGDAVLKQIAALIKKMTRGCDYTARYGGEEFAVILPETTTKEAAVVAERIRAAVEEFSFDTGEKGNSKKLTITIGLASFPDDAQENKFLIEKADQRLYFGKAFGKNQVCLADSCEAALKTGQ
jgi:diguanylate cyclase (GGDEF)-like protein